LPPTALLCSTPDAAWTARIRAFTLLSSDGSGDRCRKHESGGADGIAPVAIGDRPVTLDVACASERPIANDAITADVLVHSAW